MTSTKTAFNPFRDFDRLKADHSDIQELLNDIDPFVGLRESERLKAIGKKLEEQQEESIKSTTKAIRH